MSSPLDDFLDSMNTLGMAAADFVQSSLQADPFAQQKIYEKWVRADEWRLMDEGLPLALGLDPEQWRKFYDAQQDACTEAQQAMIALIKQGAGPTVSNPGDEEAQWQSPAGNYYRWLNANGQTVPDAMDAIMQFVMTVVKKPQIEEAPVAQTGASNSGREKVLIAALNILSKEPNACRDPSGLTNGQALAEMITAQSVRWFDSPIPPMSVEEMSQFLVTCLE